jgi:SAM-dependent methyltransferase
MSWQKYLLLPQLIWHGIRAPRDEATAWDRYWGEVERTGAGGEVLWDAGSETEFLQSLDRLLAYMDKALPIIDVGCGNGRHARALAQHFPHVIGVDISSQAIIRARAESQGIPNISFRTTDVSLPGVGEQLAEELGEVNIYTRGVLHVLDHKRRMALVQNVREMLGRTGAFYFLETDFAGSSLSYIESLGAKVGNIPQPLSQCIKSGVRAPSHFGYSQHRIYFPDSEWDTLVSGTTEIHILPLRSQNKIWHREATRQTVLKLKWGRQWCMQRRYQQWRTT